MEESKTNDKFVTIILILFVIFLIIYIANGSDYYEYKAYTKSTLTKESMKRFEKDISEGKNVSINDYIGAEYIDYSNSFSDIGYETGKIVETIMNKGIKKALKLLSTLFYE